MARLVDRLDTQKMKLATAPGYYPDGAGLYLQVGRGGARSWVFRFSMAGKTREMGLGALSSVSLQEARQAASDARAQRVRGIDPIEARRAEAASTQAAAVHVPTFREEAEAYIEAHAAGWRNAKHAEQWRTTLAAYAYTTIGRLPVADVTTSHLEKILAPIWRSKTETAKRVRGRIEAVLDRATARGHRKGDNPARWTGHFEHILPAPAAVAPVRHHPALPVAAVPEFMAALRAQKSLAARALELTILAATRSAETLGARPIEFDLRARVWTIPANRMKSGRAHRVPITASAAELVAALTRLGDDFLFPGQGATGHLSDAAMLQLLGRMGFGAVTVHGFRSTFRDWVADCTEFPADLAEAALAHAVRDKTEAAYRRGDMLDRRRALMEAWTRYCTETS